MTLTEIDNIIYEAWKQQQWRKGRNSENPRQNKCIVQFFPLYRWPNDFARHRYVPIGGDFSPFSNDFYKKFTPLSSLYLIAWVSNHSDQLNLLQIRFFQTLSLLCICVSFG